ncbi:hypothetical protein H696_02418 [Fonticula alba]|uniref:Ubiquitin-like domain-containing protein n=1 Tax=Fonticula alba TaxID=691883 RepID=A0A058ZDF9_FONAL|nr:hypothetical protein H696_02418 [Fonticula alba]KCV71472.1 hypothetical protein H696_02418 [Fonticula alba]|eukprot:XP_009494595.1 hypothetical protein H696_02418 [Fonticula alba]
MSEEKPQIKSDVVSIKVMNQDQSAITFKLKRTMPLRKVIDAYCERMGIQKSGFRFCFDGERIHEDQTPEELDMQDDDIIEVMLMQVGGSN